MRKSPKNSITPARSRSTYRAPAASPTGDAAVRSVFGPAADRALGERIIEAQFEPAAAEPERAADSPVAEPAPAAAEPTPRPTEPARAEHHASARRARHRAEPVGNRRAGGRGIRRLAALSGASAILGVTALGAVSAVGGSLAPASAEAAGPAADTIAAAPRDVLTPAPADHEPVVTSALSVASAPFTGGTQVTVQGEQLDEVAQVTVGGAPAQIVAADETQLTFAVPAVADTSLGDAAVAMTDASGAPVQAEQPKTASLASLTSTDPASILAAPTTIEVPHALSLTYTSDPRIDAQRDYVLAYWNDYNSDAYQVISGNDCANFASQSLIARGWTMDEGWFFDAATGQSSASWVSSTAMRDWLLTRPDLATPLDDTQRAQVKVGDIAQFDWDGSGDRDHTAVVTRVERSASGTRVWVGGHTKDADYWDVDEAVASGGGSVSYFSLK